MLYIGVVLASCVLCLIICFGNWQNEKVKKVIEEPEEEYYNPDKKEIELMSLL